MRPSAVVASTLLHLLLVAALLVGLHTRPREAIEPPSNFAVVFEHGGAAKTAAPKAKRKGAPETPHRAAAPTVPLAPVLPLHKFAKTTLPPAPVVPPAAPAPRAPAAKHAAAKPVAPPPSERLSVRLPEPPPRPPVEQAMLAPPPPLPRRPLLPAPRAPAARQAPPRYLVMNRMSFGAPAQASQKPRRGLNLALKRSVMDAAFSKNFTIEGKIGPDWRAELARWVNERKYYPHAAVAMDQQGAVTIRFVVESDGRVHGVSLVTSSGSHFLDEAWLGLFQGAELPRFPPGTKAKELTIRAVMHYILID